MPTVFDAVFIGAGHNSLAAALHLTTKGWKVAVFEQAPEAGGAVRTGEYTIPGFRHDWGAMNLSLFSGSMFFRAYGAELQQHGLRFVPVARPFASVFPDGTYLGMTTDAAENRRAIAALSEADAAAWDRLVADFPARIAHLGPLLGSPMTPRALGGLAFRAWRGLGAGGMLDLMQFLISTPRAWLDGTFESPKLRALLAAWGLHLDFAPDIAGGAMFPYLEGMAGQAFGMVIGEGGADTIIRAMVAALTARGGVVECAAPVARILREGGRASGVELADGRKITATRAVIANVAPRALSRLAGPLSPAFDTAMQRFDHAPGTMMIHLALDGLPDWRAGAALKSFAYVHIAPDVDQMARVYQQAKAGLLPDAPVLVVGQPTAVDPSRAPEGRHVLWLQVRMAPGTIRGDSAGEIAATDWTEAAEPFAERALSILDGYAPGIRGRILGRRIFTPADLEAANPNLVGGDQVCGSHHLGQHFLFRPMRGHADGSTPLAGLHLTGAAVWPGGGTGAGPGYLLARRLAGS